MYVEDMTLEDATDFITEALAHRYQIVSRGGEVPEWLTWDIEDLEGRIQTFKPCFKVR